MPPPAPLIDADSAGFWEATREGRIALCRCTACRAWIPRPMVRCSRCAEPTTFENVSGLGTIYSYIVVHHPSVPAFAADVPYVVALVELDEGPRLPGILRDAGASARIGERVRAELAEVPGAEERAIVFRPTA
ncbi:OB-fold domain-containing protein [Nocardioides sp. cx-169]|uniref:Zn-ribbon domain-containing OB-fold protein n=1 Tax=Nocardioides sp. cx-169 TaxID=2899080 RepID=UPI001E6203EC|nr:OB-fold domain-containing protein [Nocardioides sp. cx-169]MCD4533017.1 OB-fold domain-containing protein [Nocardioides sp. cx-169]